MIATLGTRWPSCSTCRTQVTVLIGGQCWHCSNAAPVPLHQLDPEALRENGEVWPQPNGKPERLIPLTTAYAMVERLFRATYDVRDGRRVCRVCGSEQYANPSGHYADCDVGAALDEIIQ